MPSGSSMGSLLEDLPVDGETSRWFLFAESGKGRACSEVLPGRSEGF